MFAADTSSVQYDLFLLSSNQSCSSSSSSSSCSCNNSNSSSTGGAVAGSDVIVLLWHICGPMLLLVGFIGNILVLVTMTRRRMRGTSTFVYLVGMASVDLIVLTFGLIPQWLEGAHIVDIKNLHPVTCKLQKFLDYTPGDVAVWLRMAFTIDRLVAVLFPLYAGNCCGRPSSARMYVIAACIVAVAKDMHVFWTRGAEYGIVSTCTNNSTEMINETKLVNICGYPTDDYKKFELYVRPWIAFALVSVGPFVIIAVCNALIVTSLIRRRRKMSGRAGSQPIATKRSISNNSQEQQFYQMTVMCVAASGLFLVCTAPTIVMLIGKPYWTVTDNAAYEISKAVTGILFYVTFSANFFLYCLTGKRFRTTLCGMCRTGYSSISMYSSSTRQERRSKVGSTYGNPGRLSFASNSSTVRHRSNYQAAAAVRVSANSRMINGNSNSLSGTELTQVNSCSESNGVAGQPLVNDIAVDTSTAVRSLVVRFSTPENGPQATESEGDNPAFDDVIRDREDRENVIKINGRRHSALETSC